jgi:transposase
MANIREHPVLATGLRVVNVSGKRGMRSVAAILHTMIPYWLATIPPNQVNEASRPKLVRYQREVANVLARLFYSGDAVPEAPAADPAVAALQRRMQDALREVRIARDALLLTQQQYTAQIGEQQRQIESLADIVGELQEYIPVGPAQSEYIQRSIKHLARRVYQQRKASGATDHSESHFYELLFGRFKLEFKLPRYDALPRKRYEEALAWLQSRAAELLPGDPDALPPRQETLL